MLLDASRSMSVRDGSAQPRAARAATWCRRWRAQGKLAFDLYTFGAEARPVKLSALDSLQLAREDDTRIQRALERVVSDIGEELGAVVLVSDGADLAPSFDRRASSRSLGVRVHTVSFAAATTSRATTAIIAAQGRPGRVPAPERARSRSACARRGKSREPLIGEPAQGRPDRVRGDRGARRRAARARWCCRSPRRGSAARCTASRSRSRRATRCPRTTSARCCVRVTRDKLRVLLLCGAPDLGHALPARVPEGRSGAST